MGKHENNLKFLEKNVLVSEKNNSAPIPKLDLGFGSRYRNLVSVVHYPQQLSNSQVQCIRKKYRSSTLLIINNRSLCLKMNYSFFTMDFFIEHIGKSNHLVDRVPSYRIYAAHMIVISACCQNRAKVLLKYVKGNTRVRSSETLVFTKCTPV